MYKIVCGDKTLWSSDSNDKKLVSPKLTLDLSKIGSLSFTLLPTHSEYNSLEKIKSIITVYQDDDIIFRGRVFSESVNFRQLKTIEVEGASGYLNDSIVRPYSYKGTLPNYLQMLINQHNNQVGNDKKFTIGTVTVRSPNWWNMVTFQGDEYATTWEEINNKLVAVMGGYIVFRYTETGNYIDYLSSLTDTSNQKIQLAVNLLDLKRELKTGDFATRIIALGANSQDDNGNNTRLTISSVNSGKDYVNDSSVESVYGIIAKTITFDDITDASELLSEARIALTTATQLIDTLSIKAVDLHLSDAEIQAFRLGQNINVYSEPHGINENMLLSSFSLDLSDPTSFEFSLGRTKASYINAQFRDSQARKIDMGARVKDAFNNIFTFKTDMKSRFGWDSWKENSQKYLSLDSNGNVITKEIKDFNIGDLSSATAVSDDTTIAISDGSNKKLPWSSVKSNLKTYFDDVYKTNIGDYTTTSSLSDTTNIAVSDGSNKKVTWSTIKSTLKTYFDSLYIAKSTKLTYEAGDSIKLNSGQAVFPGFITSSTKNVYFSIPLTKPIAASSVSISGEVVGRGVNGYVNGTSGTDSPFNLQGGTNYTVSFYIKKDMGIRVLVSFNSAITNATNNTPVTFTPNSELTITFS